MNKQLTIAPSEFKELANIEYFDFEEDFIEEGMRCIPMGVRFKLDMAGIKLKLVEWSKFNAKEKIELAQMHCEKPGEVKLYHEFVRRLIQLHTGREATLLPIDQSPAWADTKRIPEELQLKAKELNKKITLDQWQSLTVLQRFELLKLCRPGHENKNFPIAFKEFNLL